MISENEEFSAQQDHWVELAEACSQALTKRVPEMIKMTPYDLDCFICAMRNCCSFMIEAKSFDNKLKIASKEREI